MKLLFVCLGNICRSPVAEAITQKLCTQQGLDWTIDSAGTQGYHAGESADIRSISSAKKFGYDVTSISRPIQTADFEVFDYIIAMDKSNLTNLKKMCPQKSLENKISLITEYGKSNYDGVPDPYYGNSKDFDLVVQILEPACSHLIAQICANKKS